MRLPAGCVSSSLSTNKGPMGLGLGGYWCVCAYSICMHIRASALELQKNG